MPDQYQICNIDRSRGKCITLPVYNNNLFAQMHAKSTALFEKVQEKVTVFTYKKEQVHPSTESTSLRSTEYRHILLLFSIHVSTIKIKYQTEKCTVNRNPLLLLLLLFFGFVGKKFQIPWYILIILLYSLLFLQKIK
jgi:hypothetical protein